MNTEKFAEFLNLINKAYGLPDEKLAEIQKYHDDIENNLPRFSEFLINECEWTPLDFKSLENYSKGMLTTILVNRYFDFYYKYLDFEEDYQSSFETSNYVSRYTGKSFGFSDQDMMENATEIVNNIENKSKHGVINLGYDALRLVIVEKADKEKILDLAKELDIWQD